MIDLHFQLRYIQFNTIWNWIQIQLNTISIDIPSNFTIQGALILRHTTIKQLNNIMSPFSIAIILKFDYYLTKHEQHNILNVYMLLLMRESLANDCHGQMQWWRSIRWTLSHSAVASVAVHMLWIKQIH